jgi:hypothetical protein
MAAVYYCMLVVTLLVVVNGQIEVAPDAQPQPQPMDLQALQPLLGSMINNPQLCSFCERVIGFLKNVTENEEVLDQLVKLLLPVCDWAPFTLHSECVKIVEDIPTLVKTYTDEYLNPEKDCAYICQTPPSPYEPYAVPMTNIIKLMQEKKPAN